MVPAPVGEAATILRDRWGLAHIQAPRPYDLGVGLGYAMARERLWQLDYLRRQVRGQLAAVLGPEALPSDREMLTIGIAAAADRAVPSLSGPAADLTSGLAAGINAWRRTAIETEALDEEFQVLDYEPDPWTPADSVALWRWRWWMLTGRLENVAVAEAARRTLPPDLLTAFLSIEAGEETIVPAAPSAGAPLIPGIAAGDEGSNNWVVAGSRTTTGYPVLCSDPHNTFGQPSQWFQAQLTCPAIGLDTIGAVYAGTPGVYLGRNRHTAWGVTNHVATARDLYVEELDPGEPSLPKNHYRDGDTWRPFAVERHEIVVRGAPMETIAVRRTVRGPIVNALLPWVPTNGNGEAPPISLRWVGSEPGTSSGFEALLEVNRATSVDGMLAALSDWPCPVLNFVCADRSGRIAYHVAGQVPRRAVALRGLRPANHPDHAWQGMIPFEQLPQLTDPPRGWVATANNPPWSADPPGLAYLGLGGWADGYRFRRIRQRLEAASDPVSPAQIADIQDDVLHGRAAEVLPALLDLLSDLRGRRPRAALRQLSSWDGRYDVASVGATIFTAFWQRWLEHVVAAHFPPHLVALVAGQAGAVARRLLLGDPLPWFATGDHRRHVQTAFTAAVDWLAEIAGPWPSPWRWGRLHQITFPHPLSGRSPELDRRLSVGAFPTSGGSSTVRAAGISIDHPFAAISGSSYRLLVDLAEPGQAEATSTTGQSAHPDSPHFRDQIGLWRENRRLPLWMDETDVRANLEAETQLVPAK